MKIIFYKIDRSKKNGVQIRTPFFIKTMINNPGLFSVKEFWKLDLSRKLN